MPFKIVESIFLVLFAIVLAWTCTKVWRGRNTAANAWMLPFACFSIIAWILWILECVLLIAGPIGLVSSEFSRSLSLLPAIVNNIFWVAAIASLHAKLFSRVLLTLALLGMISIVVALVIYQVPALNSDPIISAVAVATIFAFLAASIWPLSVSRLYPIAFCMHGCSPIAWSYMFSKPSISIQTSLMVFSLWHLLVACTWSLLISEMLVRFRVMISSTIRDLRPERAAVDRAIRRLNLKGLRSETIGSRPYNPMSSCKLWAEQCNVFILIIGESYGHYVKSIGKSVVQFEFEVAREKDSEKILVYVKEGVAREPQLQEFLDSLQDFKDGYVNSTFRTPDELYGKVHQDVTDWLASHPWQDNGRKGWY